ncbi:T9SS type A sorting domain-containing protein [Melioribacter roseus]|nr:T9SS type A sorting domain-containing protein [Melioribacter roseus]
MATLVNEEKIPGNYEVEFNASNLPSGTYFCRMQAGNYSETKKMVLMR